MNDDEKMAKLQKTLRDYFPNKIVLIESNNDKILWEVRDSDQPPVNSRRKKKEESEVVDDLNG